MTDKARILTSENIFDRLLRRFNEDAMEPHACEHEVLRNSPASDRPTRYQSSNHTQFGRRFLALGVSVLTVLASAGQVLANLTCGAEGAEVTALQDCLRRAGYSQVIVDGVFGEITADAVEAFQRDQGLTVDGIAGPETLAALGCDGQLAQVDFEQEPDRTPRPPYYYDRPISGTNTASVSDRKRFVVIVPTTRVAKTSVLADVRRRLPGAAARAIDSPLGPYIEVNAFTNRSFAESQSRYLRGFGIDAQVRYF